MTEPTAKGVVRRGFEAEIDTQFICCSYPGCTETMKVPIKGTAKPGDVILNMARRRGWFIVHDGRKTRLCPTHNDRVKKLTSDQTSVLANTLRAWLDCKEPLRTDRRIALSAELQRLGIARVSETKNEAQRSAILDLLSIPSLNEPEPTMAKPNPELAAAAETILPLSESLKLPSDAARAQRRKVFHEIESCYAQGRYMEGFSDAYVAAKLMVAVGMVTEVREMNFGPAGPDPRIAELRRQIEALENRVAQIEEAALKIVDQADAKGKELRRDIASLLDKINKLEGGL